MVAGWQVNPHHRDPVIAGLARAASRGFREPVIERQDQLSVAGPPHVPSTARITKIQ